MQLRMKAEDSNEYSTGSLSKSSSNRLGKMRSKYRMLDAETKRKAIEMARTQSLKLASATYNAPVKSLKRWIKVGHLRKKGGGRKTKDPSMEKDLYQWYLDMKDKGVQLTARAVKNKAIELTKCGDFIASKGWLDKFKVRYNLDIVKEGNKSGSYPHNSSYSMNTSLDKEEYSCNQTKSDCETLSQPTNSQDKNFFH